MKLSYKFSLFFLAIISIPFVWFATSCLPENLIKYGILMGLYNWIPGIIALIFLKLEKIKIRIFSRKIQNYIYALFLGVFLSGIACIPVLMFSRIDPHFLHNSSWLVDFPLLFLKKIFLDTLIFFPFFLGSELYFRGYLWETLKHRSFYAVSIVCSLWLLWFILPHILSLRFQQNRAGIYCALTILMTIVRSPLLLDFRVRFDSIAISTIINYSSLLSFSFFFQLFHFPPLYQLHHQAYLIFFVFIYCIIFRLYLPKYWNKFSDSESLLKSET